MLPASYLPSPYSFQAVNSGGLKILLANDEQIARARTTFTAPLWYMEIGDQQSLDAVMSWLKVRRSEWPAWGKLAEQKGHLALDKILRKLMAKDKPAASMGMLMRDGSDDRSLVLGELLAGSTGMKECVYHEHRFADVERRDAFRNWLLANNPDANALLEVGLAEGTARMSQLMDEIAAEQVGKAAEADV
jgi:hypothetical protein